MSAPTLPWSQGRDQHPKLRRSVYSPDFLLQPCRRTEQALLAVICQAYVSGVSTRRVNHLVKVMGFECRSAH